MPVEGTQQVLANLEAWKQEIQKRAELAMQMVMAALEGWAKSEHRYTDRTSNTTNSISGQVAEVSAELVKGVLSAGMDYDVFLELARGGKWAFLWPTVLKHKADILKIIGDAMGGKASASAQVSGSVHQAFKDYKTNIGNAKARANAVGAD